MTPIDGEPSGLLIAQAWLGMAMTILWIIQLFYIRNKL